MAADKDLLLRAIGLLQPDRLIQASIDLINIPSPTGFEKAIATHIVDRYHNLGMQTIPQQIEADRFNAVGIFEGDGSGPTLMFCGHMDTSYSGTEAYLPTAPGYQPRGFVQDGWILGLGAYNMKTSLAAYLETIEVLRELGVPLKGDVCVACVCGEIEKAQVEDYQGALYRGGGIGAWYAVTHGALADFAVIGEQSCLGIVTAHGGYVYTKITLKGLPSHSVFGKKSSNTIHNMTKVIKAVENWGERYEVESSHLGMPAKVTVSAITGGWPYRASRVPVYCSLYVDTRLMPGQNPLRVKREILRLLEDLTAHDRDFGSLEREVQVYMSQYGSEISPNEFIFQRMRDAHLAVFGTNPDVLTMPGYTDATELIRHGIPTVVYGPGGRTASSSLGDDHHAWDPQIGEAQSVEDLVKCTEVYLALILDVCRKSRVEVGITP